jgi:PEP-CTERM motif
MNKFNTALKASVATLALAGGVGATQAAVVTLFGDRTVFVTALGGASTIQQDFEGYAAGTNLSGVQVLPNVTIATNLANIGVFNSATLGNVAFATSRDQPEAEYTINFSGAYTAFGFDINAFDPNTSGPGFLSFYFDDGDTTYTFLPVLPGATEATALFFGVISTSPLARITWSEGPEIDFSCCEETVLDNFIARGDAPNPVPEPATNLMLLGGLAAAAWVSRRREQK